MPTPLATAAPPSMRKEMRPVKYHYADTFWCTYIISVVSANIAELGKYEANEPNRMIMFVNSSE